MVCEFDIVNQLDIILLCTAREKTSERKITLLLPPSRASLWYVCIVVSVISKYICVWYINSYYFLVYRAREKTSEAQSTLLLPPSRASLRYEGFVVNYNCVWYIINSWYCFLVCTVRGSRRVQRKAPCCCYHHAQVCVVFINTCTTTYNEVYWIYINSKYRSTMHNMTSELCTDVANISNKALSRKVQLALEVIEKAVSTYKYARFMQSNNTQHITRNTKTT